MKPLLLSKQEWARLQKASKYGDEDPETVRKKEYIKYLDETSRQMTKTWPNSLENVNKRNEEIRRLRIEAVEQANSKFYKRYVKRQKQEQERLMYSARDTIFKSTDAPKLLLSAVIETAILKEREEQLKFQKQLREREIEQKRKEDEEIIRKAKEWNEKQKQDTTQKDINKQFQKEIVEQAKELAERQRKEREEEIARERVDIFNAEREMEALKEFDEELKRKTKAQILADMQQAKAEVDQRRREQEARDKLDDKLQEILAKSKCRIEKKRRETEKAERDKKQAILDGIRAKLQLGDSDRDAKEQASMEKAAKEKEAAEDERRQARLAKDARLRKERQEAREQFLRDEQQRLQDIDTNLRWEMINRYKNQEIYGEYLEKQEQEKLRKIKEFREDMLQQKKEREEREAKDKAETRDFYGEATKKKFREQDNKVLTHAAALLEEAKKNGRPTLPIHKAIDRYCKMYRLYGMPDLPDSLQAHFPLYRTADLSRPDPAFRLPTPPRVDTNEQNDDDDDEEERNGLQSLHSLVKKPKPAEPPPKAASEPAPQDYRRQGPANGLQTKEEPPQAKSEIVLPKIKVLPCVACYPTCIDCKK